MALYIKIYRRDGWDIGITSMLGNGKCFNRIKDFLEMLSGMDTTNCTCACNPYCKQCEDLCQDTNTIMWIVPVYLAYCETLCMQLPNSGLPTGIQVAEKL